jgi:hypothetical protein
MRFSYGCLVQAKITDFINNGVVEGYVLNTLTAKEAALFEQLLPQYPQLRIRLQQLQHIALEYELGILQKGIDTLAQERDGQQSPSLNPDIIWKKIQGRLQAEQNMEPHRYEMDHRGKLLRVSDEAARRYLWLPYPEFWLGLFFAIAVFVCWLFLMYTLH